MVAFSRRIVLAAAALSLAAGPALAGVPADAVNGDMSLGNPKARVHVVEYASASCPHCAHFDEDVFPAFKKKYVDTGRVQYTLKEFLTPPAEVAAAGFLVARCGGRAKYFTILDQVFRSQPEWRTGDIGQIITKVGVANGLTEAQVNSCLTDQAALTALNARVVAAAETDKIDSTPTLVVNGKKVDGVTLADLDKAIAEAAKAPGQPAAKPHKRR
ncbi:MAG: disulfide bond formation protein DsbA [Phenylobacterium sp.]|nr:disulfide bond formation protein DsbA [Phenylobacterium sp.]